MHGLTRKKKCGYGCNFFSLGAIKIKNNMKLFIYFFLGVVIIGCQPIIPKKIIQDNTKDTIITPKFRNLEGNWILSEYYDSIIKHKKIQEYSFYYISLNAISLYIKNDSINNIGLLFKNQKFMLNSKNDTLCLIDDFGVFAFFYNNKTDIIECVNIKPEKSDKFKSHKFHFRRVTEKRLNEILAIRNFFKVKDKFNQLFIDSLIAGEYKNSNFKNERITFSTNGKIQGFKNYNRFYLHDYFGTINPYGNDAILFEDTTILDRPKGKLIYKKECAFRWRFLGDTLILTKLETDMKYLGEIYYLGKSKIIYKFVRMKKLSP